jgi:peptidoglycan/LPS O-acetylase OafA/YrhL
MRTEPQESPSQAIEGVAAPRILQLDGLRALAITGVLVHHFVPGAFSVAPFGAAGVKLFFVLSGFLITGILLQYRQEIERGQATPWRMLRTFYFRRFLRIFPIYYFVLCLTFILDLAPARQTFWWHATYLTNFYIAITGLWPGFLSPFWTLAVEEQFYLVWPWVVLFTPRRYLLLIVGSMILSAILLRTCAALAGLPPDRVGVLPVACLDTLGFGALLALVSSSRPSGLLSVSALQRLGFSLGVPLLALNIFFPRNPVVAAVTFVGFDLAMGLVSIWLIARAVNTTPDLLGRILASDVLTHVGLISYGVYVYHSFVPELVLGWLLASSFPVKVLLAVIALFLSLLCVLGSPRWVRFQVGTVRLDGGPPLLTCVVGGAVATLFYVGMRLGLLPPDVMNTLNRFVLSVMAAVLAAQISWQVFEGPINRLKSGSLGAAPSDRAGQTVPPLPATAPAAVTAP